MVAETRYAKSFFFSHMEHDWEDPRFARFNHALATVMFTDIVGSMRRAAASGDRDWRATLEAHHGVVRKQFQRYRGREVKTTGDGFLALFDGPARAARCTQEIARAVRPLDLEVRAGLHTGEVEITGADVADIAVHVAARIAQRAGGSEVLTSSTVKDLVAGVGIGFADLGAVELQGLSEPMRLFSAIA